MIDSYICTFSKESSSVQSHLEYLEHTVINKAFTFLLPRTTATMIRHRNKCKTNNNPAINKDTLHILEDEERAIETTRSADPTYLNQLEILLLRSKSDNQITYI